MSGWGISISDLEDATKSIFWSRRKNIQSDSLKVLGAILGIGNCKLNKEESIEKLRLKWSLASIWDCYLTCCVGSHVRHFFKLGF